MCGNLRCRVLIDSLRLMLDTKPYAVSCRNYDIHVLCWSRTRQTPFTFRIKM